VNEFGSDILLSTYLGGSQSESGNGIALDEFGNIYVTGDTGSSTSFPRTGDALQATFGGGLADAFVTQFTSSGALGYSSFYGGDELDVGNAIDLLSVLLHEVGQLLGHDHDADGLMAPALAPATQPAASHGLDADSAELAGDALFALLAGDGETPWIGSRTFGPDRKTRCNEKWDR
jgi:hypothetical protein